jgi:23S rRNA pseudouridine1911/1915/1917 synthase
MSETREFLFKGDEDRLDKFLAKKMPEFSRTRLQKLIVNGKVTVEGVPQPARRLLSPGERVQIEIPEFSRLPASAAESVPVLFEDDQILVVNKPAGLVVHPAGPHQDDTLIQRLWPKLAAQWAGQARNGKTSDSRPGVVHRLDRGTSGVMIIAKTPSAAKSLSAQFAERSVKKVYWALAWGTFLVGSGSIRSVVGRSRRQPHRMSTEGMGRHAETEFQVVERFPAQGAKGAALLEIRPLTGRTHQIRVQLSALGHPLLGDKTYGADESDETARPMLHAFSLEVSHPSTKKRLKWTAPIAADFEAVLDSWGWKKKPKKI